MEKQHGKVKMCLIEDTTVVFFRVPTRQQIQCAENVMVDDNGKADIHKKAERLIPDCYLGGDHTEDVLLGDTELYMAVSKFVIFKPEEEKNSLDRLLEQARKQVVPGNVTYINRQLKYYRIADNPDALSDEEWARNYAILEHIRREEARQTWQIVRPQDM